MKKDISRGKGQRQKVTVERLLYLTGGGGGCLAAHAGGVDRFGRDQIQVLVVRDLIQAVTVFQQLYVQILIDLLKRGRQKEVDGFQQPQGSGPAPRRTAYFARACDFKYKKRESE